mmetsp:Transcript_14121/g.46275  ORF Transcript_14121/g.46275 Transcript_14121/m.46275 type:complete len:243 (+) Transcript_14121:1049-1777(+)|eukprot:scaffold10173_cov119-Isochrysis_galbana.AAC.6
MAVGGSDAAGTPRRRRGAGPISLSGPAGRNRCRSVAPPTAPGVAAAAREETTPPTDPVAAVEPPERPGLPLGNRGEALSSGTGRAAGGAPAACCISTPLETAPCTGIPPLGALPGGTVALLPRVLGMKVPTAMSATAEMAAPTTDDQKQGVPGEPGIQSSPPRTGPKIVPSPHMPVMADIARARSAGGTSSGTAALETPMMPLKAPIRNRDRIAVPKVGARPKSSWNTRHETRPSWMTARLP